MITNRALTYEEIKPYIEAGLVTENLHPEDSNIRIFNYTPECQFDSKWDDVTIQCRGLIMNVDTDEIIARPFPKFFNYDEHIAKGKSIPNEIPIITDKLDGCCDESTILITKSGSRTIKEICDGNYRDEILSRNLYSNENEWDFVDDTFIKENTGNWYEIELENGTILKLTGNHKMWLPELQVWRKVEELNGSEIVQLKN